jgi:hypothetical protein
MISFVAAIDSALSSFNFPDIDPTALESPVNRLIRCIMRISVELDRLE